MAHILPYEVGSAFNVKACWDCPVQQKCEGGTFIDDLETAADDSRAIIEGSVQAVAESFASEGLDEVRAVVSELGESLLAAKERQDQAVTAGAIFLQKIVEAHGLEPGRALTAEDAYRPALEEFTEAPLNTGLLNLEAERLELIASSVVHYADVGVCGAIEILRED